MKKGEIACHNVFHSYLSLLHQNVALCGNGLNYFIVFRKESLHHIVSPTTQQIHLNQILWEKGDNVSSQHFLLLAHDFQW